MAYEKNKHLANIKKWKLDLSLLYESIYYGDINAPIDIKEFKGFKELCGFEIKEVKGSLNFRNCTSLTSVSNFPECIGGSLNFRNCTSLLLVSNLPECIGGYLSFFECTSLTSILKMPSVVKDNIFTRGCPFFENLAEDQIREKYGIRKE